MSNMSYISEPEPGVDLVRIAKALLKATRWIVPLVLLVSVSTLVLTSLMTPKYRAESRVLIETQMSPLNVQRNAELERAQLDQQGIQSQVQVLSSRNLAQNVITRLKLDEKAEFGGEGGRILSVISSLINGRAAQMSATERVVEAYFDRLRVYNVKDSRVIVVQFWSYDPVMAADVTNTLMAEYKALQAQTKRELNFTATVNLEPEIVKLQQEVEDAERLVADYRAGRDLLVGANNTTLSQQQLSEINTQLTAARARHAEAEAQASLIRSLLSSGGSLETAPEVLNSPLFQRLRERQVALQSQVAELSATFLNTHPRIQAIRSQLADIDRQVRNEARNILEGIDNEARVAAARVASFTEDLDEIKATAAEANEAQVELSTLEREADVKAAQLSTLLRQFSEAQTQRSVDELPADARVISRAVVPNKPHSPNVFAATLIAGFATTLLSILAVVLREMLTAPKPEGAEDPLPPRASHDAEDYFGHSRAANPPSRPSYGHAAPLQRHGAEYAAAQPVFQQDNHALHKGAFAEAAFAPNSSGAPSRAASVNRARSQRAKRATFSSVTDLWRTIEQGPNRNQCILVLSMDDEALADASVVALTRQISASRLAVALDLNENSAAARFMVKGNNLPGLWDLLEERADFEDIIFKDNRTAAHVIGAGLRREANAGFDDELGADQLEAVFEALSESYDHIIANAGRADHVETAVVTAADQVILIADRSADDPELAEYEAVLQKVASGPVQIMAVDGIEAAVA